MVRRVLLRHSPVPSTAALVGLGALVAVCLGVVSALPSSASAAVYAPVAEYSFDEGAGETVEDLTGDGHTATIHGADWTTQGRYGGAMEFDASAHDYLSIPADPGLDGDEELTVEAWVRPTATPYYGEIVMKEREGGGPAYSWTLDQHETEAAGYFMQTEEGMVAGGQRSLPNDTWTHVAMTDDGAHNRLYVNGRLLDTEPAIPFDGHGPIRIGGDGIWEQWFDGRIDEVRIYDRAIDQAEVDYDMEAPIQMPRRTPVAEYSFDEGEGETVEDLTGDGHTATVEGAEWTEHGRYGGAMEFDPAKEAVVKVPDSPELDFSEEFTLEAWVRPDSAYEELVPAISKAAGEGEETYGPAYGLYAAGAEYDHPMVAIRPVAGPKNYVQAGQALPAHAWSHVAMVYDGSAMHVYVDGEEVNEAPSEYPAITAGDLEIGGAGPLGEYFDGRIDEVRIYNRGLSPAEVAADMEAPIQTPKSGPIAAFAFDEGEGTTVEDVSGNGHTATLEGGAGWAKGRYGDALHFFKEGDCASVADSPELRLSEEFTLEAWVRPEGGVFEDPVVVRESGGEDLFGLGIGSREEGFAEAFIGEGKGSHAVVGGDEIRNYEWVHLAATWDGAAIRLYVDGELAATEDTQTPPGTGEGALRIGCDTPDGSFGGRIDEVRVYARALDAAEVGADMQAPLLTPKATPVAAYSFDEGEGEVAEDVTGDGHTATVEGARWTEHGRYGGAYEFEAEEEELKIPASPELDFNEEFTLEAWVRPSGADNHHAPLIDKQEGGGRGYFLYEGGLVSDRPYGAASEEQEFVHADDPLPARAWSHVALTFTGNRTYLYVDGELIDNGAAEPLVTSEGELEIGGSSDTAEYFDGRIDEVRIYNRGLSPAEIATDMEAPIQTPKQGPIAAWSFDEVEGTTVEDLTGDGHTATVEGAVPARGKYGEALQFDGEDDLVKVPNSPEFALTEGFTLESWVRPESGSSEWAPILAKAVGGGEAAEELAWWLYEAGHEPNVPFGGTEPAPGVRNDALGEDPLPVDAWSHVALTYDGSQVVLYVDGELVDCSPAPSEAPRVTEGELQIGGATEEGDYFEGRIDEVRIYNRALSQAEIQASMSSTFPAATTELAEEVRSNDGVMTGTVEVHGPETEYLFEYGPTTAYGSVATGEELEGDGETVEVEEVAINLAPATTYHYRLVALSPLGISYGKDKTFTTGEPTMTVQEEEEEAAAEEAPLSEGEGAESLAAPAAITPNPFFGIDWDGDIAQMAGAGDFTAISDSGAKWFRFVVAEHNESQQAQAFAEAESHDLSALPYLGQGAFPKSAAARNHFFKFAKEMVNKYGPGGKSYEAETWEIWNEPNMPHMQGVQPGWEGRVNPKEFAEFYKELVTEIRKVAPEIHILAPGLFGYKGDLADKKTKKGSTKREKFDGPLGPKGHETPRTFLRFFDETLEEEPALKSPYQGISLHPYVFKTLKPPKNSGERSERPHAPGDEADAKQVRKEIKGMIRGVQDQAEHDLHTSKPIWVTELGFPVRSEVEGKPDPSIPAVTVQEQALLLRATFAMLERSPAQLKIEHAIYYNIQDLPGESWEHHAGLLTNTGYPRPAGEAFRKLAGGKACTAAPC